MEKEAFIAAGQAIFGKSGWKGQMAEALGVHPTTITRYVGGSPIPDVVALAVEALRARKDTAS